MSKDSYPGVVARSASGDFEDLLDDIESVAAAAEPAAVRDLRALQLKYRLINQLIERRHSLRWSQKELAEHSGIARARAQEPHHGHIQPARDCLAARRPCGTHRRARARGRSLSSRDAAKGGCVQCGSRPGWPGPCRCC